MELQLEAFEHFLTNDINLELSQNKLFGILLLENGNLTPLTILEEDFNKYNHVFLTEDSYPNIEDIRSQISDTTPGYPIVILN
jgi:hypothetical protein